MEKARLKKLYEEKIHGELKDELGIANSMEVPRLTKVVINAGLKEAVADNKILQEVMEAVMAISGQLPTRTRARKSIAGFKLREGMPIGVKVTLRRNRMYEFLYKLINLALPKTRDFQGVPTKLDRRGNYNLGIKEATSIFSEIERAGINKPFGINITIETTARTDEQGRALLNKIGMPFRK
jgi:large subunit ribosomal protein L5